MKRFFSICLVAALTLGFVACEEPENGGEGNKPNNEQNGGNNGGENNGGNNNGGTTDSAYACLNGSDYYVIVLGETYFQQIASRVKVDFRPNDVDKFLYVWNETYTGGTCSGPNVFGDVEDWTCLITGNVGWTGMGYCVPANLFEALVPVSLNPSEYVLHIAMKSQDDAVHEFVMYNFTSGGEIKVKVGDENSPYGFKRDGEWYEIEIPLTEWTNQGLLWTVPSKPENVLGILSGAVAGKHINLDACFIYKPAK